MPTISWTCRICGRTGFEKPTAHGCLNKPPDWVPSRSPVASVEEPVQPKMVFTVTVSTQGLSADVVKQVIARALSERFDHVEIRD